MAASPLDARRRFSYAFDDVRYLLPLWHRLDAQLTELGRRDWATQDFARFMLRRCRR